MNISGLRHIQLLFLITTFLAVQWTATHVHFSEDHNHGGNTHNHQIETHTHQFISINNSSPQLSHSNVIELDLKEYKQNRKKYKVESLDIAIQNFDLQVIIPLTKLEAPSFINTKQGYSLYSSSNPRAPPLNS